jgi:hypothetical protein
VGLKARTNAKLPTLKRFYGELEGSADLAGFGWGRGKIMLTLKSEGDDDSCMPNDLVSAPQAEAWKKLHDAGPKLWKTLLKAWQARGLEDVRVQQLIIHSVFHNGIAYIGVVAHSTSDQEHGAGAMLHGKRVVETGGADVGILEWIAERDAAR